MTERELKLHVPAASRDAVMAAMQALEAKEISLNARYFDTPQRTLALAGIALRLRLEDGQWMQTVKARGDDELTRIERNDPRPDATLDLSLYDGTPLGDVLTTAAGDLALRYETRVRRHVVRVRTRSGVVELAYDNGIIASADETLHLCELEFEHVSGDDADLFCLAETWLTRFRLVIDLRSKSERGDLLARRAAVRAGASPEKGPAPDRPALVKARKPGHPILSESDTPARAYLHCLNDCLNQIVRNATFLAGTDHAYNRKEMPGPYLRQLRVGIRRLRSCWAFFKPWLPLSVDTLEHAMHEHFSQLGTYQDADMILTTVAPRLARAGMPAVTLPAGHVADPRNAIRLAGDPAFQTSLLALLLHSVRVADAEATRLPPSCEDGPEHEKPLKKLLRSRLDKWLKALLSESEDFNALSESQRHDLRKKGKRLRYALGFCESLMPPKRADKIAEALADVQASLGELNDLSVAQAHYRHLTHQQPQAWFALGWLAATLQEAHRRAHADLQRLAEAGLLKK